MYAIDYIKRVDELRPNSISIDTKVEWLSRCDLEIYNSVIRRHEGCECICPFRGKTEAAAEYGEMMIKEPFDKLYEYYLMTQIDLANADWSHYENSRILHYNAEREFSRMWHRTHMPLCKAKFRI